MEAKRLIKIGLLVIVSIALLVWGLNFLKGHNYFNNDSTYYAIYNKVDGLQMSSPVQVSGFKVGQIRDIGFLPDHSGRLLVEFAVQSKYKIPKPAVAHLFSSDIMGSKAITLEYDTIKSEKFHESGDTLASSVEGDLKDQVSMQMLPLKAKAESLMGSVDSVLAVITLIFNENAQDNINKSFASIKTTIKNLENTTFTLDTMVTNEQSHLASIISNVESITANLEKNNEPLTKAISNFKAVSDSLADADIKATINNANLAIVQVNDMLRKLDEGEGAMAQLMNNDTLYTYIENATYNLNRLLKDMRQNPKRYVHFSAFDLGRTVYVVDEEDKRAKSNRKNKREKVE